jgi:hypothetical protein
MGDDADNRLMTRTHSLNYMSTTVCDAADRLTSRQFGGTGQTPLRIDLGYTARDQESQGTESQGAREPGDSVLKLFCLRHFGIN